VRKRLEEVFGEFLAGASHVEDLRQQWREFRSAQNVHLPADFTAGTIRLIALHSPGGDRSRNRSRDRPIDR